MEATRFLEGRPVSTLRVRLFLTAFAICGIALFATTWRLWTPQTVYPQVPLFQIAGRIPAVVEWLAILGVALGLAGLLVTAWSSILSRWSTAPLLLFISCVGLLFVADQHRLQPWVFQFALFALVLAALPAARAFVLLRWLVVSIYFWSAVAKLDYSFADTLGQQFLETMVNLIGMSAADWSPMLRHGAALLFPLAELVIAVGLSLPLYRLPLVRHSVLVFVCLMHGVLILCLSPWGLNHQPPVILWNVWFIAQAFLLFGVFRRESDEVAREDEIAAEPTLGNDLVGVVVEFVVAAAILLPLLNLIDRYDHWLAWGLYAPRNSRATLYVQSTQAGELPEKLKNYLSTTTGDEGWRKLDIDRWSLDALAVPIYPQDRFQVGVADAVIRSQDLQQDFQLVVEQSPDRWTGRRPQVVIRNMQELGALQQSYLLNARPRVEFHQNSPPAEGSG